MNAIGDQDFVDAVLIEPDDTIIDGVIRVEAAKALRLSEIPCAIVAARTAQQKRLLRLTLNRLGEKGSWSIDTLKVVMSDLIMEQAPIEITGFQAFEIDGLLTAKPRAVEVGPLEPAGPIVAQTGDVFLLGCHRVACGDARDPSLAARLMSSTSARIVLTDEPFNVFIGGNVTKGPHRGFLMASGEMTDAEFLQFNIDWMQVALSHLVDGGVCATFIDWRGLPYVLTAAFGAGLSQLNFVVWTKTNAGMGALYRSQYEFLPMFKKGTGAHVNNIELGKKGRWRSNVWTYAGASSMGSDARKGLKQHPTVKPVVMLADALLDLTMPDEIVLDPFLGSGSTLIAAESCRRICYGVELDPGYVDVILRRYQAVTGQEGRPEATGQSFSELAKARLSPSNGEEAGRARGAGAQQGAVASREIPGPGGSLTAADVTCAMP